jgi:hypothetical protein
VFYQVPVPCGLPVSRASRCVPVVEFIHGVVALSKTGSQFHTKSSVPIVNNFHECFSFPDHK